MRPAELIRALATQGMELLEDIASGALTRADLGQTASVAGMWERLAGVYFGPSRQKKLQSAAVAAGRGLPVAALERIEKHLRNLLTGADVTVAELRVELCGLRGTVDEIDREAAARVLAHNRTVKDAGKKAYGKRALRGGKNTDALGNRTFTVTGPERVVEAVLSPIREAAHALRRDNPQLDYDQAMFDAFLASQGGGGTAEPLPVPFGVMRAPDYVSYTRGEGGDTVFGLSDGTTITGREWVEKGFSELGYVGIFDPVDGGIDLYREQRFANFKQRMLLKAETLLCPYPECTTAADECQFHHITAWEHEGETNLANMTAACRVHNGRNDDDPNAPPRHGRLERLPGGVVHIPPDGGPPRTNRHPLRKLSAMGLLAEP